MTDKAKNQTNKGPKKTEKPAGKTGSKENSSEQKTSKESFSARRAARRAARKEKRAAKKAAKVPRIKLHKSFRRSYREDYVRGLKAPGLMAHAVNTFKLLFKNWKIFLPLLLFIVFMNMILVGLLSEETYVSFQDAISDTNEAVAAGEIGNVGKAALTLIGTITTGGLNNNMSESQQVFLVILVIITWLVTIYLVRHLVAGHKPKMRDGLYNALTPLISTLCIVGVIFIEAIPIMIVLVTYSAAVSTEFLATPFYALLYFIFAGLLLLLSGYLISSSFLALIAITAPGLYPLAALNTATDLVLGRRIRLLVRLFFGIIVIAFCWIVVMMPIIIADAWFKTWVDWLVSIPIVPFFLSVMTTFTVIYISAYSYLYYRQLLDFNDK